MEDFATTGITDLQQAQDTQSRLNSERTLLNQEDFFTLMTKQLEVQDPLSAADNPFDFFKQLATMQSLEATTSLSEAIDNLNQNAGFAEAATVIGTQVTTDKGSQGLASAVERDEEGNIEVKILEQVFPFTPPTSFIGKEVKMLHGETFVEGEVTNVVYKDNQSHLTLTSGIEGDFLDVPIGQNNENILEVTTSVAFEDITKIDSVGFTLAEEEETP